MADEQYRNKTVINQRGATVEIVNSTNREDLKLSQFSGSNITLNNVVNSELATNNKQTKVINDSFESVAKDKNTFVGKDNIIRVRENTYNLKGFENNTQLAGLSSWKEKMYNSGIPGLFGQFIRLRGSEDSRWGGGGRCYSVPAAYNDALSQEIAGNRTTNSTLIQSKLITENLIGRYCPVPQVLMGKKEIIDEVTTYEPMGEDKGPRTPAGLKGPTPDDIFWGSGDPNTGGTGAPGVMTYGPNYNSATEGGDWELNEDRTDEKIQEELEEIQQEHLNKIEQAIGNGGDEIEFIKRSKFVTIGGAVNNYPSIRVDPQGRSQPIEVAVGDSTSYTNIDFVPHVEEVNNDLNFPCGDYTLNVGNRYNVIVGSGGVQMKTSGAVEIGGTAVKVAGNKLNLMASEGMHLHSANLIELNSDKSISLRSKRQIYIEPNLGVKGNMVVGGGAYVEGELFVQHITAPVEIQQTEDTTLYGKFNCRCGEKLEIGYTESGEKVYASEADNLILNYPHSHHFKNLPLKMMASNKDVRRQAQCDNINRFDTIAEAVAQNHERKPVLEFDGQQSTENAPGGRSPRCTPEAKDLSAGCEEDFFSATGEEDCPVQFESESERVAQGEVDSNAARREGELRGIEQLQANAGQTQGTNQALLDERRRSQEEGNA